MGKIKVKKNREVGCCLQNGGEQEVWLSLAQCGDGSYEVIVYLGLVTYGNQW